MSGNRRKPFGVRITVGRTDDGKQLYKYIGYYETRPDALIALAEYNKNPFDIDSKSITFAGVYERFMQETDMTESIRKLCKTSFNHSSAIHKIVFRDLRKSHLQGVINSLATVTGKSNTALFFRKLFSFASENDIILKDYSQFVTAPAKNKSTEKIPFTYDEISLLWNCVEDINAEIMLVLCYSGMRVNELLLLEKSQINLADRCIITGSKTDAGKDRYIPIHSKTLPIIEKHMKNPTRSQFCNIKKDNHIRYDSFHAKRWTKLKKKLGFRDELTIHSSRHFFITELHTLGVDRLIVQNIVGHKGIDITEQRYIHLHKEDYHKAVNLIN